MLAATEVHVRMTFVLMAAKIYECIFAGARYALWVVICGRPLIKKQRPGKASLPAILACTDLRETATHHTQPQQNEQVQLQNYCISYISGPSGATCPIIDPFAVGMSQGNFKNYSAFSFSVVKSIISVYAGSLFSCTPQP